MKKYVIWYTSDGSFTWYLGKTGRSDYNYPFVFDTKQQADIDLDYLKKNQPGVRWMLAEINFSII